MSEKMQFRQDTFTTKPPFIAPLPPIGKKNINVSTNMSGATSSDDFFSIVSKKLDSGVVKSNDVLKSSNLTNKQSLAKGTALFQNMLISSGYKHIDHAYLAQIDQNGTLANSERIKDANFKRYDQVLMNGVAAANADQIVKKKKSKQSWKDLYDIDMNFDGQSVHNFNFYNPIYEASFFKEGGC